MQKFMRLILLVLCTLLVAPAVAQQQSCVPGTYVTGGATPLGATINFRASPALDAPVFAKLTIGTPVTVLDSTEGAALDGSTVWCRVVINQVEGYVHSAFLVPQPTATPPPTNVPFTPPTLMPTLAARVLPGCDTTAWILAMQPIGNALSDFEFDIYDAGAVAELQSYYDAVDTLDYPECLITARLKLLSMFEYAIEGYNAIAHGDNQIAIDSFNAAAEQGNQFIAEISRFAAPTASSPVQQSMPQDAACPSLSATCSTLTCNQAYACLRAGNLSLDRDSDGVPCETQCGS